MLLLKRLSSLSPKDLENIIERSVDQQVQQFGNKIAKKLSRVEEEINNVCVEVTSIKQDLKNEIKFLFTQKMFIGKIIGVPPNNVAEYYFGDNLYQKLTLLANLNNTYKLNCVKEVFDDLSLDDIKNIEPHKKEQFIYVKHSKESIKKVLTKIMGQDVIDSMWT